MRNNPPESFSIQVPTGSSFCGVIFHIRILRPRDVSMMMARPWMKFGQGSVPKAMPMLPSRVCIKFIIAAAVPTFSLTSRKSMSMLKGRTMDSMIVKGRKAIRKSVAAMLPVSITSIPLMNAVIKLMMMICRLAKCFFNQRYSAGPMTAAAEFTAK